MKNVYLLLGSNMGKREENLAKACILIEKRCGKIVKRSSLYETGAWGITQQANFINQAINITTGIEPFSLLALFKNIEAGIGRTQTVKWGPRIIDIDILFYGNEIIDSAILKVPHPAIQDRKFTLVPLNEIASSLIHPLLKKSIAELLSTCKDESLVNKINAIE